MTAAMDLARVWLCPNQYTPHFSIPARAQGGESWGFGPVLCPGHANSSHLPRYPSACWKISAGNFVKGSLNIPALPYFPVPFSCPYSSAPLRRLHEETPHPCLAPYSAVQQPHHRSSRGIWMKHRSLRALPLLQVGER